MKQFFILSTILLLGSRLLAQIVECDTMTIGYVSSAIKFSAATSSAPDSMISIPMINNTQTNFAYPQIKLINTTPLPTGMSLYTTNWNVFASSWNVGDTAAAHVEYYVNNPIPDNYTVSFKLYVTNFSPLSIDSCVFVSILNINLKPTGTSAVSNVNNERNFSFYPNPAKDHIGVNAAVGSVLEIYTLTGMVVLTATLNGKHPTIDISGLPAGVYLLREKVSGMIQKLVKIN